MNSITHIKIAKPVRDRLKIIAIYKQTTLQKLTDKIFDDFLRKFNSKKPNNKE